MKKEYIYIVFSILFSLGNTSAQVKSANHLDNLITTSSSSNTGVAINPDVDITNPFNLTVSVVDLLGSNSHEVSVHQNTTTTTLNSVTAVGEDPDVAYMDGETFFVAAVDVQNDILYLNGYNFGNTIYQFGQIFVDTDQISYPNIDINLSYEGVIVYEKADQIIARSFTYNGMGAPVLIAPGTQPDVAIHENIGVYTVTYIDKYGRLAIISADYNDLIAGNLTTNIQHKYSNKTRNFSTPRIACIHDGPNPTYSEYTVVVNSSKTGEILGYFNDSNGNMNANILINKGTESCQNNYPVVTYHLDRVSVAWSSNYSPCVSGGTGDGVLKEELDFSGNSLTAHNFDEVNQGSSTFHKSKTAISSQYSNTYNPSFYFNESIVYHDGADIYWKNRNSITSGVYKTGTAESGEFDSNNVFNERFEINKKEDDALFSFDNIWDIKTLNVYMKSTDKKHIIIYNLQGQQIMNKKFDATENEYTIDYSNYPSGIFIVSCTTKGIRQTIKISNH